MNAPLHAKVFWSGGSQAVRLPKECRLPGVEVLVHRSGRKLVLEPLPEADDWAGFWEQLKPLEEPIRRGKSRPHERRKPL